MVAMTDLNLMDEHKILERYVREAVTMTQAEIMEKAARALGRIQDEMRARIDRALRRPAARNARNSIHRLGWLESFEPEGGLRAQVDAAARAMGLEDRRAEALETLLASGEGGQLWEPLPLFEDIARKASKVRVRCAATMDRTSATTRHRTAGPSGPAERQR
jgi:hypothetical protein